MFRATLLIAVVAGATLSASASWAQRRGFPVARHDREPVVQVQVGDDREIHRRLRELENTVARLQSLEHLASRVHGLEVAFARFQQFPSPRSGPAWTCYVKGSFNNFYTASSDSRTAAEAATLKQCMAGESFGSNCQNVTCSNQ